MSQPRPRQAAGRPGRLADALNAALNLGLADADAARAAAEQLP